MKGKEKVKVKVKTQTLQKKKKKTRGKSLGRESSLGSLNQLKRRNLYGELQERELNPV